MMTQGMTTKPQPGNRARVRKKTNKAWLGWLALALFLIVVVAIPIVPLQATAFTDGGRAFRALVEAPDIWAILLTTLQLAAGSLVIAMVLGVSLALAMRALRPRTRTLLSLLPVLPLIIPSVAHVVGFVFLFSPTNGYANSFLRSLPFFADNSSGPLNIYSLTGIIVYTGINLSAFVYLFVFNGLGNLGQSHRLAARVNGASPVRALFTVTLPMLRPSLLYAAMVCVLLGLGQFTGPLLLGRRSGVRVLTTEMYEQTFLYPVDYGLIAALGTPLILLAILLVFAQRRLIGNQDRFVGHADSTHDEGSPSSRTRVAAGLLIGGFTAFAAVLPLLAIMFVSISEYWSGQVATDALTLQPYINIFNHSDFTSSIFTTLQASLGAVLLVIPLGMIIALGVYNSDKLGTRLASVLDSTANVPLAVPAALMGFGFLFAYTSGYLNLYGTLSGFIVAFVVIMIPYSVRYQLATYIIIGRSPLEAASVSGANPIRSFFTILLPLSRTGVAASASLMFILLVHEFGVAVLLRSPNVNVMSVVLFQEYDTGSYPNVAAMAVIMSVITAIGVLAAFAFGGRRALERM